MAEFAIEQLTKTLIQEATVLSEIADRAEWIESEVRLMQAFLEHLERSGPVEKHVSQWAEDLNNVARDAEDAIETFVINSARGEGILYWIDRYNVGKELERIIKRMRDISERSTIYDHEQTSIGIVVESAAGTSASHTATTTPNATVDPAVEKLSYILNEHLVTDGKVKRIVEEVRDEVVAMQSIVSNLLDHPTNEREKVWLEEVRDVCDSAVHVVGDFVSSRERWVSVGGFQRVVLSRLKPYEHETKLGEEMKNIRAQLGDALVRRLAYGVGGEDDVHRKGSRPRSMFPVVPQKRSPIMDLFLVPLLEIGNMLKAMDKNFGSIRRDLALMGAFLRDTERAEGLNERQKVWIEQIRVVAQHAQALLAEYERSMDQYMKAGVLRLLLALVFSLVIKFGEASTSMLHKIEYLTSARKTIYGIENIRGSTDLASSGQWSDTIVEHNDNSAGTLEEPLLPTAGSLQDMSHEYWPLEGLKGQVESLREEMQLMDALFKDVQEMGELDGRYKVWVEQMRGISLEAASVSDQYATKFEHKPFHVKILNFLFRFGNNMINEINKINDKIQDALRRRKIYGLMNLSTTAVSSSYPRLLQQLKQDGSSCTQTLDKIHMDLLPLYLRRCLFYFLLFPDNLGIPARRLVVLWVAEGLVHQGVDNKPPEDVAEWYLTELITLGVVQVDKEKHNGKVKTCRLTNQWREVLLIESKKPRFLPGHTDRGILHMAFAYLRFVQENFPISAIIQPLTAWLLQLQREPQPQFRTPIIRQVADHHDQEQICYNHIHGDTRSPSASLRTHYSDVLSFLSFDHREGSKPGLDIGNFLKQCIASSCFLQLRVLDLERVYKPQLPENIGELSRLRYLGLRWTYLESLPSSVSRLLKLQTLDLKHTYISTLTSSIWKMQLRHLFLSEAYHTRFPPQGKHNYLYDLQTLWGLFIDEESPVKGGLDKLVNIKKLGLACQSMTPQQGAVESQIEAVAGMLPQSPQEGTMESQLEAVANWLQKLNHLESLRLKSRDEEGLPWKLPLKSLQRLECLTNMYLLGNLSCHPSIQSLFPKSLIELTLSHSKLKEDPMQILKDLPKLQSLCLFAESYMEKTMLCQSRCFPALQVLKLWKLEQLEEWTIEHGALPRLGELEIRSCERLKMLPEGLQHVTTLLKLELTNMSKFKDRIRENGDDWHKIAHIPDRGISFLEFS